MKPAFPLLLVILGLLLAQTGRAQDACPGCIISIPADLPADTLYLSPAPDGQAGVYYEADISFRVPQTTDPVTELDPDIPPGLTISSVEINTISNVPPGLEWGISQTSFNTSDETDGCFRFCGTPLQPGLYIMEVSIDATVVIFTQTASFNLPILILPASSSTDGFTMENSAACGSATVDFSNNVPSEGQEGFSYSWDFGNGASSTDENPIPQTYSNPGMYEVQYEATVDTIGFILTQITVDSADCSDLLNGPDLKLDILTPDGTLDFVTPIVNNASLPISWSLNYELLGGEYTFRLVDADSGLGGSDDVCGEFTVVQTSNGPLTDGASGITINVIHPVDTIRSVDTVFIFEEPSPPVIFNIPATNLCEGELLDLATNYASGIQWYADSSAILGGTDSILTIENSGTYWVTHTTPDGCIATSEMITIDFATPPSGPVFTVENNLLTLFNPDILPDFFTLQWFLDDEVIPGANELSYCISETGLYRLELTDVATGCTSFSDLSVTYDPGFENCVSAVEDPLAQWIEQVQWYPNPFQEVLQLNIVAKEYCQLEAQIMNVTGQVLEQRQIEVLPGQNSFQWNLPTLPAGIFTIILSKESNKKGFRVIKNK